MGNKIGKALYVKNALPFVNRTCMWMMDRAHFMGVQ